LGEAGAEYVMPTGRLPNGKLGVLATGGGINVTVNNLPGQTAKVSEDNQGGVTIDIVMATLADDFYRGGKVSAAGQAAGLFRRTGR
jgi:hypothetical protein